jgi:parallel beta-helix repeat protein
VLTHHFGRAVRGSYRMALLTLLMAMAAVALPAPVARGAATYYVATNGSDSNDGSSGRPWRTVQKAADVVPGGSTVAIRAGTYAGFVVRRSGTSGAPTTYTAAAGAAPVINGDPSHTIAVYIHDWASVVHDVKVSRLTIQNAPGGRGSGGGVMVQNGHHITLADNIVKDNRSYGIYLYDAYAIRVARNEITRTEVGIYVTHQGEGDAFVDNRIHHNDRMVINTPSPNYDDYGATGIAFNVSTGHVSVTGNRIWGNRATSYDYTWDGSGIELWMSSNVDISGNSLWDNENVLETGSDGSAGCSNNRFTRNDAFGATTAGRSFGMYLRCATNMLVANNTFYGLKQFTFQIAHRTGVHGGAIDGLRVENNVIVSTGSANEVYWVRSALPSSVVIDRDLAYNTTGGRLAYVDGRGSTTSLATFHAWTGREASGIQANPRLTNATASDFRLLAGSPAIDKGIVIAGVTDGYVAAGPDIGRYERH